MIKVVDESQARAQLESLRSVMSELLGIYRQLLDVLRIERDALISVDVKQVRETTLAKDMLIATLRIAEDKRTQVVDTLIDPEVSLEDLAISIQAKWPEMAQHLRSTATALRILVRRAHEQNAENQSYAEHGLKHLSRMRSTLLGEDEPKQTAYGARGQKVSHGPVGHVFSQKG